MHAYSINNSYNVKLLFATHMQTTCSRNSFRIVFWGVGGWVGGGGGVLDAVVFVTDCSE